MRRIVFVLSVFYMSAAFGQSPGRMKFITWEVVVSPEVNVNKTVTFRLLAPNAQKVELDMSGFTRKDLVKGSDGLWTVTTETLVPDIYTYKFIVDGLSIPDPSNPAVTTGYKMTAGQSLVMVPGDKPMPWEMTLVNHGEVIHHFYTSKIIGDHRDYYVYTPPGYDAKRKEAYPVLVLLHGLSENASAWLVAGHANFIMDNLIAEGKIPPMVLVFPLGYGDPDDMSKGMGGPFEQFSKSLLEELLPEVEKRYHVTRDPSRRAIAGLSMGGGQSLYIGLNHPEKFAYVGGFSSAVVMYGMNRDRSTVKNPEQMLDSALFQKVFPALNDQVNSKLKLIWFGTGDKDGEINFSAEFKYWLSSKKVKFDNIIIPGNHTWMVWKRNLVEFSQKLFR
jgi:enterochelin esterase-like enzyme